MKKILVGYDNHTIYKIYIKDQNKVLQVKNLRIFKNFKIKPFTNFSNYKNKPTFEKFLLADRDKDFNNRTIVLKSKKQKVVLFQLDQKVKYTKNVKELTSISKNSRVTSSQLGQKVNYVENANNLTAISFLASQTNYDMSNTKHNIAQLGQEVKNIEIAKE